MPTQRTDDEILAEGPALLSRLGRHLNAVEQGENGAGDDLAGVLRILLDKTNNGNKGMMRLAAATNLPLMDVYVSGPPDLDESRGLFLSFGNLPLIPAPGDGQPHTPHTLTFKEWIETPSLIVPGAQRRSQSWGAFASLAANTRGAHLSTTYHDLLVASDLFGSAGLSLQDYLLRQVGWVVERVLADLLARAGKPLLPRTRRLDYWPRMLIWGWFRDRPGDATELMISVNVTSDDGPPVEVIRYMRRGQLNHVWHAGQQVSLVIDEPTS